MFKNIRLFSVFINKTEDKDKIEKSMEEQGMTIVSKERLLHPDFSYKYWLQSFV